MPVTAGAAVVHVQPRQQPERVGVIAERLRDLQPAPERRFRLLAVALGEHGGVAERRLKLELPSAAAIGVVEHCECAIGPDARLVQQIELDEQTRATAGKRHAQIRAVIIGVAPSQRRAGIGEQARPLMRAVTAWPLPPCAVGPASSVRWT